MKRRTFLSASALASLGFILSKCGLASTPKKEEENPIPPAKLDSPTIISTWKHGTAANKAAWETLERGKTALDAVESGVRLIESDADNKSVG